MLSPDISPQPSPLARAAVAASKARSALAPTQTSNDDAASVDKRQPDAFKAFLDVAADLPEAAPPVSRETVATLQAEVVSRSLSLAKELRDARQLGERVNY